MPQSYGFWNRDEGPKGIEEVFAKVNATRAKQGLDPLPMPELPK